MATKYKVRLTFVGILLIFSLLVLVSFLKYQKYLESTSPLVLVEDGLSINFLKGNQIHVQEEKITYIVSVTNNTDEEKNYYISLEDILLNQEDLNYDLTEQNNKIKILQGDITKEENTIASMIKINPLETHFLTLTLYGKSNLEVTAKLKVGIEEGLGETFASILLNNNKISKEPTTKVGEDVSTTNEGLIEANDEFGTTYYFRGAVENNYVEFASLQWRVVRINSDGSVRLILNDYINSSAHFYEVNNEDAEETTTEDKLNFSKSKMMETLNTWYQDNLLDYEKSLISNKYCVDDSVYKEENGRYTYLGNARLIEEKTASVNCLGKNYTSRIGILSADEVVMAGATTESLNTDYYLYIPNKTNSWWTLTPSTSEEQNIVFFEVDNTGRILGTNLGTYYKGVRPVVNLIKKTSVNGKGTEDDPYVIKQ